MTTRLIQCAYCTTRSRGDYCVECFDAMQAADDRHEYDVGMQVVLAAKGSVLGACRSADELVSKLGWGVE